jgi:hypothetical protein
MAAKAFRHSETCGLHLLTSDDKDAEFCMSIYNRHGCSPRLFNIMVTATATGRASGAVVTALAVS